MKLKKSEQEYLQLYQEMDGRVKKLQRIIDVLLARIDMLYEERHYLKKEIAHLKNEILNIKS